MHPILAHTLTNPVNTRLNLILLLVLCQAVTFLHVAMDKGLSPQAAALALVDELLSPTTTAVPTSDNVTVLVVQFAPMPDVAGPIIN